MCHNFMKGKKRKSVIMVLSVFLLDVLVVESRMSDSVGPECVDMDTHTISHMSPNTPTHRSGSLR